MSNFSNFINSQKQKDLEYFFGKETEKVSNKYIKFNHILDDDNIIIVTKNVKILKDNFVLVVDNNKVVYLKDWQVREIHNFDDGFKGYAIKLNKNFFKPYTFNFTFEDIAFEKEETFDDLKAIASTQNETKIALGF